MHISDTETLYVASDIPKTRMYRVPLVLDGIVKLADPDPDVSANHCAVLNDVVDATRAMLPVSATTAAIWESATAFASAKGYV